MCRQPMAVKEFKSYSVNEKDFNTIFFDRSCSDLVVAAIHNFCLLEFCTFLSAFNCGVESWLL